jgi:hypothetical protein
MRIYFLSKSIAPTGVLCQAGGEGDVMSRIDHALVVGGTGMLCGVSLALARRARIVSVIARHPHRLKDLQEEAGAFGGLIHPVAVDYRETRRLISSLLEVRQSVGVFSLSVVWVHSTAPEAPLAIAGVVSNPVDSCPYYHVLSSAVVAPSSAVNRWRTRFELFPGIEYHEVILGFTPDPRGSRWLTHEEICKGVLEAIELRVPSMVVGTVTPWSARP